MQETRSTSACSVVKLIERVLDGRTRKRVGQELGEEPRVFKKGRGRPTGVCVLF